MLTTKELILENQKVKYYFKEQKHAKTLLFLHGYGSNPENYFSSLKILSQEYNVFAPGLFGLTYFDADHQIENIDACISFIRNFISHLNAEEIYLVGHSIGGAASFMIADEFEQVKGVLAINPVLPQHFSWASLYRYISMSISDMKNPIGEFGSLLKLPAIGLNYISNILKNPKLFASLGISVLDLKFDAIFHETPSRLLYSNLDAMFSPSEFEKLIESKCFPKLSATNIGDYSHNWPIYHPELFISETKKFINQQ